MTEKDKEAEIERLRFQVVKLKLRLEDRGKDVRFAWRVAGVCVFGLVCAAALRLCGV